MVKKYCLEALHEKKNWSLAWDHWFRAWEAQCMCTNTVFSYNHNFSFLLGTWCLKLILVRHNFKLIDYWLIYMRWISHLSWNYWNHFLYDLRFTELFKNRFFLEKIATQHLLLSSGFTNKNNINKSCTQSHQHKRVIVLCVYLCTVQWCQDKKKTSCKMRVFVSTCGTCVKWIFFSRLGFYSRLCDDRK